MRASVSEEHADSFHLDAVAAVESLDGVHDLVETMRRQVPEATMLNDWIRFETALIEIVDNIIEHGASGADGPVGMQLTLSRPDGDLLAEIVEDSAPVDIELDAPAMPDVEFDCGRGLAMARALGADVSYRRSGSQNLWSVRCRCEV